MKVAGVLLFLVAMIYCVTDQAGAASNDEAEREPSCDRYPTSGCPKVYEPYCGTDKVTYANECELCQENRKKNAHIRIKKDGPC
ncbi:serine protease inhibitor Kazal-type 1-like [Lissotriton helveticus]